MRVGHGYDVHRLVDGRELIIGGVEVPYTKGLLGHSDADVLIHAVMDALLGAAGFGDIGRLFPDSDPAFLSAKSTELLKIVCEKLFSANYTISNIDCTILAEEPKFALYINAMKGKISKICCICEEQINIKATTEEGLGFTGKGQGICAHAVVCLN